MSSGKRRDANVLSTPILKLHMDANEKGTVINKSNMLLTAQEKINIGCAENNITPD